MVTLNSRNLAFLAIRVLTANEIAPRGIDTAADIPSLLRKFARGEDDLARQQRKFDGGRR